MGNPQYKNNKTNQASTKIQMKTTTKKPEKGIYWQYRIVCSTRQLQDQTITNNNKDSQEKAKEEQEKGIIIIIDGIIVTQEKINQDNKAEKVEDKEVQGTTTIIIIITIRMTRIGMINQTIRQT